MAIAVIAKKGLFDYKWGFHFCRFHFYFNHKRSIKNMKFRSQTKDFPHIFMEGPNRFNSFWRSENEEEQNLIK